jgi:hypothetical protein
LTDESARRCALIEAANHSPDLQRMLMARCADDPVFWFNTFAYTYDPRKSPSKLPFVLFPKQEEYIRFLAFCLAHNIRSITEKTRDMGVTWLNTGFDVHGGLFRDGYKAGIGSRKEDLIDRSGDPDCIFWKARYMLDNLPGWMVPKYDTAHMRIVIPPSPWNPSGGSITGEAGINIGRGGRNRRYTVDESAFVANPESIDASLSENTPCRNDTSTPFGPSGPFAELRHSEGAFDWQGEDTTPPDAPVVVFTLHWRDHPEKDETWYEKKKKQIADPAIIAQELDIDYTASVRGNIIPIGWVNPCIGREIYQDERGAVVIGGDVGEFGEDPSAAVIREGRNIHHIEEWGKTDPTQTAREFIRIGLEWEEKLGATHLYFFIDKIGIGAGVVSNLQDYVLREKKANWFVVGVQAGERSPDPRCLRLKDCLWWRSREWFQEKAPAIADGIPKHLATQLAKELGSPTYAPNESGLIVVESKKKLAKRGIKSPNLADALIHTHFWEAMKPLPLTEVQKLQQLAPKGANSWMAH